MKLWFALLVLTGSIAMFVAALSAVVR